MSDSVTKENTTVVVELLENAVSTGHISQDFASCVFSNWLVKQTSPSRPSSPVSPTFPTLELHSDANVIPPALSIEQISQTSPVEPRLPSYVGSIRRKKIAEAAAAVAATISIPPPPPPLHPSLINSNNRRNRSKTELSSKKQLSWGKRFVRMCACGSSGPIDVSDSPESVLMAPRPASFSYPPIDCIRTMGVNYRSVPRVPSAAAAINHMVVRPLPVAGNGTNRSLPSSPVLQHHVYSVYNPSESGSTSESLYETTDDYQELEVPAVVSSTPRSSYGGGVEEDSTKKRVKFSLYSRHRPIPDPVNRLSSISPSGEMSEDEIDEMKSNQSLPENGESADVNPSDLADSGYETVFVG